ncbi:type II toxin-antitoxin system VapC family toxin [Paracidobacterium acidisoli]|uniref:Ribonuclease VapC n=1 Tax=Paracidobacterium acidisoli TaxID=2303751 RepID=A0A372IKR4_9BACT|nr:type II toxin-antitoxin system VapC family toxin [Paracidobacterium acidisoli]MBT9332900.1 type II toxin-antitoxin system VapC family toxin [Paracidobacterium acidisoli]
MILVDVNLLIYAVNEDAPEHRVIREWLEKTLSSGEEVGFAWVVLLAFLRLTTRQGLFTKPLPVKTAFELMESWLEQPAASVVHPGPKHFTLLRKLLEDSGTGGNLTTDAHLAAMAIERDAELCSLDRDFARFAGLRWRNPLLKKS